MESQALQSLASGRLSIDIGQVPLTLYFPEGHLLEKAGRRYARFRAGDGGGLPVFLEPGSEKAFEPARFSYALDDASLYLGGAAAHFRGVRHEYALDSLLRILLTALLLPQEGFLLHAATVVRGGRAYIFTGRSGAGKSTVASLSPEGSVLTDEISLLRFSDHAWQAYGTPFWGEFRAEGGNRRLPVAGIYTLVQANENRAEPLTVKEALRALLPNVLFFGSSKRETEELMDLLENAARAIPFFRLRFVRDASFWKAVA